MAMSRPRLSVSSWCVSAPLALLLLIALLGGRSAYHDLTSWVGVGKDQRDVGHPYPDSRSIFDDQGNKLRWRRGTTARVRRVDTPSPGKVSPEQHVEDVQKSYEASLTRGEKLVKLFDQGDAAGSEFMQYSDLERFGWREAQGKKSPFSPAWTTALKDLRISQDPKQW